MNANSPPNNLKASLVPDLHEFYFKSSAAFCSFRRMGMQEEFVGVIPRAYRIIIDRAA
jgi:hypothetical protein